MVLARVLSVAEMQHTYLPGIPGWNVFTVSFLSLLFQVACPEDNLQAEEVLH